MLSLRLPFSGYSGYSYFWNKRGQVFNIKPVKIHEVETAHGKPARALKHLIKLNHANFAVLYNERKFHNHIPHVLASSFLLGANADDLTRVYEAESKEQEQWAEPPGEISMDDWRDFLGLREYQRAFLDYFEDELVRCDYDWKGVVHEYLFSGPEPVFNSIIADLGHPLIHLAYAFEMSSREISMEALSLAMTCYGDIHKYLDDPAYSETKPSYCSNSPLEILERIREDKQFDGLFNTPGDINLKTLFQTREAALLEHWNAWKIQDPVREFCESQRVAAALLAGTRAADVEKYDFFLAHILTTSHAVRVLLPLIPTKFQAPLVKQWWLMTVTVYIAQLRPEISFDRVEKFELKERDWKWATDQAIEGHNSTDAHYVKTIRAFEQSAATWGDPEHFYLKAAVKFAEEFTEWGGFA